MRKAKIPLTNFQFGELSPSLISRTDTKVYNASAQKIENFFLRAEGGVIKRAGLSKIYEFDTTVDSASFTITVTDYANIVVGSQIKFMKSDGTVITIEFETAGGSSPSASVGNKHFVRSNEGNDTVADNLYTAINAISGFTVANPSAAVVTVVRDDVFVGKFTSVSTTDTTRLAVTNFSTSSIQQHRLIPFIFSDDERYIVSLEHLKIRVFSIDTNNVVTLATTLTQDTSSAALPITNTNIHQVTYAQSGDTMFIAHQTFMVRKLVRTGLTSFQMETKTFDTQSAGAKIYQPYFKFQDLGVTLDPSASSGTGITLTTSANYWDTTGSQSGGDYADSKHVGITIKYHDQEITITSVQSATQATGNALAALKKKLKVDSFRTNNGVATVEVTLVNHGFSASDAFVLSNADTVGGIAASNLNGSRTVAEVIDDNTFTFNAAANASSSVVGGGTPFLETHAVATNWSEQSYSALRGYPGAVTFHQNRLWYGGTLSQPDGLWASKTNEFFNFDLGEAADNDSIDITAAIGEVNTIKHLVSNRDLQCFTSTDEFIVPAFVEKPTTPTNATIKRQTPYGSSFVKPYVYDGATVYIQGSGEIVREMLFDDGQNAYTGQPISSLSSHLIKNPLQATALAGGIDRAESYYFIVDADGTLSIFNSNRQEQRYGWTQFTSQGSFQSLCTVDTRVYAVLGFDKGGGTNKFILCEFDTSFNTDFSKVYSGASGVFDVSADFANGAVLDVIDGTHYLGQFTVSSGNINVSAVDNSLSLAEIGYKFDVTLKTNPIDSVTQEGVLSGEPRSLNKVIVDLSDTLSCSVNSKNLIIRQVTDDLSQDRSSVTGKKEFRLLGFSKDPQVTISQAAPLSLQINSIIAEITF
tara:strand:- start:7732 stop:10338 length:2607 start_codon:yes stop_codon:yes gene_type:complete